jgi:hypothetical protein
MAKSVKLLEPIHPGEILSEEFMKPLGISIVSPVICMSPRIASTASFTEPGPLPRIPRSGSAGILA